MRCNAILILGKKDPQGQMAFYIYMSINIELKKYVNHVAFPLYL